ncbi:hypothetical protein LAZ67_22001443 [Cordylochernes scorpioides]|uniref:DUF5641 domain-containing protein n=1 Tax=Cordylochernes scorpioides TaxID=51811 RepID=A0ABY6LP36_9ARAC|nr:hypothetical protein LAZ67_22001443 [Cordylochernes scorpioides]
MTNPEERSGEATRRLLAAIIWQWTAILQGARSTQLQTTFRSATPGAAHTPRRPKGEMSRQPTHVPPPQASVTEAGRRPPRSHPPPCRTPPPKPIRATRDSTNDPKTIFQYRTSLQFRGRCEQSRATSQSSQTKTSQRRPVELRLRASAAPVVRLPSSVVYLYLLELPSRPASVSCCPQRVKVDRITEDSSMQRMTEVRDEYVADALTNMQPHCEDRVSHLTDAIRGLTVPRAKEVIIAPIDISCATNFFLHRLEQADKIHREILALPRQPASTMSHGNHRKKITKPHRSPLHKTHSRHPSEAVMNGRPMTYVSDDPNDLVTISPSMFLQEQTDIEFPECQNMGSNPTTQKLRYLSKLREELKSRFRKEYLSLLVQRNRRIYNPKLQAGDVVLVAQTAQVSTVNTAAPAGNKGAADKGLEHGLVCYPPVGCFPLSS